MTKQVTVYHNPRCTKSRQTLSLLQEQGLEVEIVEYLKDPPDEATLKTLIEKLEITADELVRRKEFLALGVDDTKDPDELVALMAAHPEIIQRPIVVVGRRARLGRPPENVLDIL